MDANVLQLVRDLEVTKPISSGNLQVFGLRHQGGESFTYTVLDDALVAETVEVTEVDEGGRVSELKIVNKGDTRVFVMAGEMLLGAKQNRVINASMMIDEHSETVVPVTCIEQGRWGYRSRRFRGSGSSSHARLRRKMSGDSLLAYKQRGRPDSDQGGVWREVSAKLSSLGSSSASHSLFQAYEDRKAGLDDALTKLAVPKDCTGVAFAMDGRVAGVDVFDRPETLMKLFPKLVRSYAIDAIEVGEGVGPIDAAHVTEWLRAATEAPSERFKSPGLGDDVRIKGADCIGACLVVEQRPVHAELFPAEEAVS